MAIENKLHPSLLQQWNEVANDVVVVFRILVANGFEAAVGGRGQTPEPDR